MVRRFTIALAVLACLGIGGVAFAAEAPGNCNDGVDNDADGKTDCQNTDCKATPYCVCRTKGTEKEAAKAIAKINKEMVKCRANADKGKATVGNCVSDALGETGTLTKSANYGGKIQKVLAGLHKALAKRCAGTDEIPYTPDDIGDTDLDFVGALQLEGWGASVSISERMTLLTALKDLTSYTTTMQNVLEEDCIVVESLDDYQAKPKLQRLMDIYQCLVMSEGIAMALKSTAINTAETSIYKAEIVPASAINITYDAGADLSPPGAPDGTNDTVNIPSSTGCPLPGIGACAADPNVTCSLAPGSGSDTFCLDCAANDSACPGSTLCSGCPLCVEGLTGPDGVVAPNDIRTQDLDGGKCIAVVTGDTAELKCVVDGVNGGASTSFAGTCEGGPNDGVACTNSSDCDSNLPPAYACISGDEYYCQVHGVIGSNPDNSDSCSPCLAALVLGPPGTGCGAGGGGLCAIATCVGGARDGQICDITGATSCIPSSGGICGGVGGPAATTGDEVGFYAPSFSGMAYLLCPLHFRLDFSFDILNGAGVAISETTAGELNVCLPPGSAIQALGCYIHENTGDPGDTALIEFFADATPDGSTQKLPCPSTSLPLPGGSTGLSTRTGTGPIIGVAGVQN